MRHPSIRQKISMMLQGTSGILLIVPADKRSIENFIHVAPERELLDVSDLNRFLSKVKGLCSSQGTPEVTEFYLASGQLHLGRIRIGDVVICLYPSYLEAIAAADALLPGKEPPGYIVKR